MLIFLKDLKYYGFQFCYPLKKIKGFVCNSPILSLSDKTLMFFNKDPKQELNISGCPMIS